jgi:multicomponent Na+:H+ antiporter subunit C
VQALTLTDIVVSVTVGALLLALSLQKQKRAGTTDPDQAGAMRG